MLDLVKIKEDFSSLVLDTQPWTLAQFVMWLDLKLSEYKIRGYMHLDHDKKTKPRWLVDPIDEAENTSDTAPAPPPCRKPCCWTDRADPMNHYDSRGQKSHDFLAEYQDNIPDTNKCIVDLSEPALSAQRSQREDTVTNIDQDRLRDSLSKESSSEMSFQSTSQDVIEIPDHDLTDTGSPVKQFPQTSPSVSRKQHTSGPDYNTGRIVSPSVKKKIIPSSSVTSLSATSPSKSATQTQRSTMSQHHSPATSSHFSSATSSHFSSTTSSHFSPPSDVQTTSSHMETQQSPYTQSQSTAASHGPVPVALHAAGSEAQGQMVFQPDSSSGQGQMAFQQDSTPGLGDISAVKDKCMQLVQDVKKEFDIVEVSSIDQSVFDSSSYFTTANSDDENWTRRFVHASWSPGQIRQTGRRPISEAAKKVELPKFEDPIVRRVLEDTSPPSRHIWSKIITRCAYHMLSKGVPHKHDYQIFSEAFYHRYPCIGTNRGPNPWIDFAKTVSQKVRTLRWKAKKTLPSAFIKSKK